jgi:hypothetical protein
MVLRVNSRNKTPKKSLKKAALAVGKNPQLRDEKKTFRRNFARFRYALTTLHHVSTKKKIPFERMKTVIFLDLHSAGLRIFGT